MTPAPVRAGRASALLYRLLRARRDRRPFLVPANVCGDVEATFEASGVPIQAVDLDPRSLALDLERCANLVAACPDRFGGVLFVRPYGAVTDVDEQLQSLLKLRHDLVLVDDRCLCPADPSGRNLSRVAHVALFSSGPRKPVSLGGGGFAFLRQPLELAEGCSEGPRWLQLNHQEVEPWESFAARLEVEAERAAVHRLAINAFYREHLPETVRLPDPFQGWRFHIRVPQADQLVASIFAAGLFASRHYSPIRCADPASCPVACRLAAEIVNLFNDRHFDLARAQRVVQVVNEHLETVEQGAENEVRSADAPAVVTEA
jgi:hypothetical protein